MNTIINDPQKTIDRNEIISSLYSNKSSTPLTNKELLEMIDQKTKELDAVKNKLKNDFVGIDSIIDQVIENIKIWYIFPDLQIRPTIISMWGSTGVGKTDLVRKLVSYLNMQDKFLEIEMNNSCNSVKTIQDELDKLENNSTEPAILLLDEFQNFRTINASGGNIQTNNYNDIWILLSDGKFQNNVNKRQKMLDEILSDRFFSENKDDDEVISKITSPTQPETQSSTVEVQLPKKEKVYKTYYWTARSIKRLLKLPNSLDEIMKWSREDIINLYYKNLNNKELCEGENYKKLLIIISGNLDEAYTMSENSDDVDVDADIYHEFSKKINIINIKNALKKRFKPEQIARFGNNHITYPCLNKSSYYKIIQKKCLELSQSILEKHKIELLFDSTIYDLIYKNGVFPTQGVRPVLSTITNIMGAIIPPIIYSLIKSQYVRSLIKSDGKKIIYSVGDKELTYNVNLEIEKIKNKITNDKLSLVGVHELGHSIIYALLFGTPPSQININTVSIFNDGFVFKHTISLNKNNIKKQIMVHLAGQIAEEIVFGNDLVSIGSIHDLYNATSLASSYVRKYGFDGYIGHILNENRDGNDFICGYKESSDKIEEILKICKDDCKKLIEDNIDFYKSCLTLLMSNKTMSPEEMCIIAKKCNINIQPIGPEIEIINNYNKYLNDFLKK
jgi:hypothetical protein